MARARTKRRPTLEAVRERLHINMQRAMLAARRHSMYHRRLEAMGRASAYRIALEWVDLAMTADAVAADEPARYNASNEEANGHRKTANRQRRVRRID